MKKRFLLICALFVSAITLSGAANRSFRTEMEQWNPIGFTQATNGITQARSDSPITNRLTAGSAILPTVATAAPSGVLRGGSANVITFTTSKKNGEEISLYMKYSGAAPTLSGATGTPESGKSVTYTLTSQTVTITGDVTYFACYGNQLTALDLSRNTALTGLNCEDNQLTALDLSQNTALIRLYCEDNQLTTLDVSQNTALRGFWCDKNQLTALDVSKNTALQTLACTNNQLTALDVSKNTALTELCCPDNQLTALDVSQNTALAELYCYDNQLKELDVSKNTALTTLGCDNNQLTALDVSQNTALTGLYCQNNQLTALDVSKNTALTNLGCSGNQIEGEEMTRLVNSLPDRTGKDAGRFIVVQGPAPEGNICLKSDVAIAKGKNWNTQKYNSDTKKFVAYEGNPYIMSFTTAKAVGEQISLYMKYSGAAPILSGATGTPESEKFITYTLTSKTVTITGDVTELYCNRNQLTTLDVSKNTKLTYLNCESNQLTTLDVSRNTALTGLDCNTNQLTALDVSQNTSLTWVTCSGNQIKCEEMARLVNGLPDRMGKDAGQIVVVQSDAESNRCLKSDVAIAKSKNWNTLKYKSDIEDYVDYEGEEPIPYAVTLTKEGEGTLTATGAADLNAVPEGTELTIEATPAAGYELKALTANGTDILATKKFVVTAATEVKATFTKKTFAVTLTKEGEGTINATGAADLNAVPEGTELTIEATPADGYELKALTANGTDILATKKIVVKGATEVKATFAKKTFAVTLTKEGEGTLTATGAEDLTAVLYGTELTIEATPAEGYELKALTANGTDILATKKFTVTADTEVKATFAKKTAADVVESSSVRLYPNPASTYVNVKGAKADALVRLYDANGTLRYEARTDADGTLQIDLSAYPEGTYLLRVGNDAQRLLIQR